jgi:hypothetical protein
VVGPVLNFYIVGTAVGGRPILLNTFLERLSSPPCAVYAVPSKGSLNILLVDFDARARLE